ncbi:MAG TPA: family 78 glycoside hydrolase catalytic domain [Sedimentisphaerales bacterium]|nr:family 78 glycoside hydrolase catalytic domain [Sedimentisphaerales bacterium]
MGHSDITVKELRCEYAVNPLGVDTEKPRFSWTLESSQRGQKQTAYHILVASSVEKLQRNKADKWDSGKVVSERSVNVEYGGRALKSGEMCWWKVRCWGKDGKAGQYSDAASFEMGLVRESDWQGKWIGAEKGISSPLLRRDFEITKKVKQARVYVSGLGWSELYINGKKVGDHVLDPATSEYHKHTLYVTHDVTGLLGQGGNAVGVMLGNGWYCEPEYPVYGDSPRMLLQMNLEFIDGTKMSIVSDESWKTMPGPITHNDFWMGEVYDARAEKPGWAKAGYDDSNWSQALIKSSPGGKMVSQVMPAIKVVKTMKPVRLSNPEPGIYVYDMGQLFGGWVRVKVRGEAGTKLTIKYSPRMVEDGGWDDKRRLTSVEGTDCYILRGDPEGEVYEPRFTYHPVRYVQLEGYPGEPSLESVEGRVVRSAVDMSGDFECSNPLLNQIHRNVVWTLSNELFGIPLDCLYREHWAWTDPATVTGTLYPRKFMPGFWTKWLTDIQDAQFDNGAVPVIAPNYRIKDRPKQEKVHGSSAAEKERIDAAWGGNYPILVWYLHQYYGDDRILAEHYPSLKKWIAYLSSTAPEHIVTKGAYGDHMLPGPEPGREQFVSRETPRPLVWTAYYYRGVAVLARIAERLGKQADARRYSLLAENIREAFNKEWLDKRSSQYATGSQTANLLPLAMGIVPRVNEEAVLKNVIRDINEKHGGHLHTGNSGTTCMIDTLTQRGYGESMYKVATQTTYPGWGYMVEKGATTIWEAWGLGNGQESMIMWATIDEFFYNNLAGINGPEYYGPDDVKPGFEEIHIKPHVLGDLTYAKASIRTIRGWVTSEWLKKDNAITLKVTIPVNSDAQVSVPKIGLKNIVVTESGKTIYKNGRFIAAVSGITGAAETDDYVTFETGSGSYSFSLHGS